MSGFWRELRRRRVVSAAGAYAAAAFVLLQLAEILLPAFGLGPEGLRALLALLLAGFPVVLALSWMFDVTLSGLRRTEPAPDAPSESSAPGPVALAAVLVSSLVLGALGWWAVQGAEAGGLGGASSIAVLPFADFSPQGDQGHLGDGLAEEILNILAGIDGLQVAARTSSFAFRESGDAREIGQQLGVEALLEGSVRRDGSRVRVTAQLIDTRTGFHAWSDTYDLEVDDLFALQDSIAAAVADELLVRLNVPAVRTARHLVVPAAQDAYWRGRAQWNRRDAIGIPRAVRLFEEALAIDSLYPEAYAGLADSYALLPQHVASADPDESWANAERLARRALELNPDLAEAHASLGLVLAFRGERGPALAELDLAIQLNPSYAPALHWRANVLAEIGRLADARDDAARAAAVDPLSAAIAADYGHILLWAGDLDGAEREFQRALDLEFGFAGALFGSALVALAREEEVELHRALAQWTAVAQAGVGNPAELARAMLSYARTGAPAEVPDGLRMLSLRPGGLDAGTVAALHALVGARDETLVWLGRSLEDRSWVNQYLRVNTVYEPYRDDPRFLEIVSITAG